jgi:hypothetical protein
VGIKKRGKLNFQFVSRVFKFARLPNQNEPLLTENLPESLIPVFSVYYRYFWVSLPLAFPSLLQQQPAVFHSSAADFFYHPDAARKPRKPRKS